MAISNTTNRKKSTANSGQTCFEYNFFIFKDDDLQVYVNGEQKQNNTHYTVTGAGKEAFGEVVFVDGLNEGDEVILLRVLPLTQESDYEENDSLPAQVLENDLNKCIMICQQLQEQIDRTLIYPVHANTGSIRDVYAFIEQLRGIANSAEQLSDDMKAEHAAAVLNLHNHLADMTQQLAEYVEQARQIVDVDLQSYVDKCHAAVVKTPDPTGIEDGLVLKTKNDGFIFTHPDITRNETELLKRCAARSALVTKGVAEKEEIGFEGFRSELFETMELNVSTGAMYSKDNQEYYTNIYNQIPASEGEIVQGWFLPSTLSAIFDGEYTNLASSHGTDGVTLDDGHCYVAKAWESPKVVNRFVVAGVQPSIAARDETVTIRISGVTLDGEWKQLCDDYEYNALDYAKHQWIDLELREEVMNVPYAKHYLFIYVTDLIAIKQFGMFTDDAVRPMVLQPRPFALGDKKYLSIYLLQGIYDELDYANDIKIRVSKNGGLDWSQKIAFSPLEGDVGGAKLLNAELDVSGLAGDGNSCLWEVSTGVKIIGVRGLVILGY
ncbi:MAG: hypothetical protein ACNI27_03775 [Desulfovibrio sp.]